MDTRYWLAPHVALTAVPDAVVMLDLRSDRYLAVALAAAQPLAQIVCNWPLPMAVAPSSAAAVELADSLEQRGVLLRSPPVTNGFRPSSTAEDADAALDDYSTAAAPLRWCHATAMRRALRWARASLAQRSLWTIANELNGDRYVDTLHEPHVDADELIALSKRFRQLRAYYFTGEDQCLLHALCLHHFLCQFDVRTTWVIGVRLNPWAAHSWVQHARIVLNDTPEHIRDYAPILTV